MSASCIPDLFMKSLTADFFSKKFNLKITTYLVLMHVLLLDTRPHEGSNYEETEGS